MPMILGDQKKLTHPFYVEYHGSELRGRYRGGIITPNWTTDLDTPDPDRPLKFVEMFLEVCVEWDAADYPKPYEDSSQKFLVGDAISFKGSAYRIHQIDEEKMDGNGESPSPDDLPARGETSWYGPFQIENLGPANEPYPVPLTREQVASRAEMPFLARCMESIITAARENVDDAKKDE
jgi:hypothetical protein